MIGASVALGGGGGQALWSIVIYLAVGILNFAATFKIITKAGYSGWWIILPLASLIAIAIAAGVVAHEAVTPLSTTSSVSSDLTAALAYWIVAGVVLFANWLFFIVFAFSDWPIRRQLRQAGAVLPATSYTAARGGLTAAHMPTPTMVPVATAASARPVSSTPVWTSPAATATATARTGSLCPSCFEPIRSGASFCGSCGRRLAPAPASPAAPNQRAYDEPAGIEHLPPIRTGHDGASGSPGDQAAKRDDTAVLAPVDAVALEGDATPTLTWGPEDGPRLLGGARDLGEGGVVCASCAAVEPPSSVFCGQCGARVRSGTN